MSKKLPDYDVMEAFYPAQMSSEAVKQAIGGGVNQAHYKNTCIIRVSLALNRLGHSIPPDSPQFRTQRGTDKKWYGLRVEEFWGYMLRVYGAPAVHERREKTGTIDAAKFSSIRGIIGFRQKFIGATGHFTLWNGSRLLYDGGYPNYFATATEAALWSADSTRVSLPPF
jgi:hypothetical protein